MSEMYRSVFKLPLIPTRDERVRHPMVSQTITPGAGPLCRYRMQPDDNRSSQSPLGYLNTALRTGACLKIRHCATPVSSFAVRDTRVAGFL